MPKTKKTTQPKNLSQYNVYIEDTSLNSEYFNVNKLPQLFTGGRNSFLLGGSQFLKDFSEVFIEILDVNNIPIYSTPIKNYIEGESRLISLEIYDSTPSGYATIIIVGTLQKTSDNKEIPLRWKDKINVRWSRKVLVEPRLRNTSPIKLINPPDVFVEEKRFYNIQTASFSQQYSDISASLTPLLSSGVQSGYLITTDSPTSFSADYFDSVLTGSLIINGVSASVNLPITKILNKTTAFTENYNIVTDTGEIVDKIYLISGSYNTTVFNTSANITSSVKILYNKLVTSSINIPISYAKIRVTNLNTVSGEIFKTKTYSRVYTNTSTYKLIAEVPTVTQELLVTSSIVGELPIGDIYQTPNVSSNWYADELQTSTNPIYPISASVQYYDYTTSTNTYPINIDDAILLSSIYANIPTYNNVSFSGQISESGYFIGNKLPVTLVPTTEYTLTFDAYYKKTSGSVNLIGKTPTVDIYIIGVNGSVVVDDNPLGQKIGQLNIKNNAETQWFESNVFNFKPNVVQGSSISLRFVISNGFWNFSNISLKPASDELFSPDEVQYLVPNTEYYNEYLQYKVEFFDINNNSIDLQAISTPVFFTGSNVDLGTLP